ncbi:MAG: aldo/keto reductase [Thermoplasmata archaeon]|nr:aldo/keto reductase [Thermoplasmata archaeon]
MTKPSRRRLGRSELSVAPLALGGNVFGWTVDDRVAFPLLDAFVDAGFNLIDTADTYSVWVPGHKGGESEEMIGRWLRAGGRRDEVILATKVGMETSDGRKGLSPDRIRASIEGSLRRLQTDRIDLYQAHVDDPATPLEGTLRAFSGLRSEGRIRAFGASNYSALRLEEALRVSSDQGFDRFESLQPRYNLLDRKEFEGDVERVCVSNGLGVLTYSALASGFLSGKYRTAADATKSARGARGISRLDAHGQKILEALDDVARRLGAPRTAVAIAWILARPSVTAPIASATSPMQLEQLLEGTRLSLDREALDTLARADA